MLVNPELPFNKKSKNQQYSYVMLEIEFSDFEDNRYVHLQVKTAKYLPEGTNPIPKLAYQDFPQRKETLHFGTVWFYQHRLYYYKMSIFL